MTVNNSLVAAIGLRYDMVQLGKYRPFFEAGIALTGFTIFDLLGRQLYTAMMARSVVTVGGALLVAALAHLRWRRLA